MAVKRLIAAVSLVALVMTTLVTTAIDGSAASSSFSANPSRLHGHGELAVISRDHHLYLLGGRLTGVRKVALQDPADDPMWSHDGRWLAVTTQPTGPNDEPTTIWLVSRSGHVVRPLTPKGQQVLHATAAWSPRADRLAISYTADVTRPSGATQQLDVVDISGAATSLASAQNISGFAWAPNGRRLAVGLNHIQNPPGRWDSRLVTIPAGGGGQRTITTDNGNILVVAGWWPNGSGVLAWRDFQGSGSIAADGLPLLDISTATGHRRQLTKTMLQYPSWLATSKVKDEVALIAGGNRELTNRHKHLVVCTRTRCHSVPQPAHKVTFDPAWSLDGRLAAVRDRAVQPTAANGYFTLHYTHKVDASGGIDLVRGRRVHAVRGGGQGTAPVWGARGAMMFVRGSSLWLLNAGATTAHRLAGPLSSADAFYGFVSWQDSFAWTQAAVDSGRLGSSQVI